MVSQQTYPVKNATLIIYILFLLGACLLAYKKPVYNWDILPYAAIVLQYDHVQGDIHQQAYRIAAQQLPAERYHMLAGGNPKRAHWATDSTAFHDQLPFYVIKPLYTLISFLCYKCGMPLMKSTVFPSVLAYFFSGILLFIWLRKYLSGKITLLLCIFIMLLPNMVEAAALSTPDLLSAFFMLLGLFFLLEKRSVNVFFGCFLLAMLSRIDFILPLLILLTTGLFVSEGPLAIKLKRYLWMTGSALLLYMVISYQAKDYGWSLLYFPSFFQTLTAGYSSSFSFHSYITLAKDQLYTAMHYSQCVWILLLGTLAFMKDSKGFRLNGDNIILPVLLVSAVIRFIMQPAIADRFYIGYCLVIIVLLIKQIAKQKIADPIPN